MKIRVLAFLGMTLLSACATQVIDASTTEAEDFAESTPVESFGDNGVRDDIDEYLDKYYYTSLTKREEQENAIERVAASLQFFTDNSGNPDALRNEVLSRRPYLLCLIYAADENDFSADQLIDEMEILTLNSPERFSAYLEANYNLRGQYEPATLSEARSVCPETVQSAGR